MCPPGWTQISHFSGTRNYLPPLQARLCFRHHRFKCGTVWAGIREKKRSSLQCFYFIFIQTFCCPRFPTVAKITTHCGGGGASWQSSWFIPHLQYKYKTEQATWGWLLQGPFPLINSSCKMITSKAIFVCKLHADALWWSHRQTCVAIWHISKD